MSWFALPGTLRPAAPPLGHYRPAEIHEALACVPGGGLWLDVGTGNPAYVRELVSAGCRVIAVNLNPFTHLALQHALHPLPEAAINAALAHLLDRPKGDRPLVHHIRDLYRSRCPRCGRVGVAQRFLWEREGDGPVRKQVRCALCGLSEGETDAEDAQALQRFKSSSPAYHLALRRATLQAPEQEPALRELLALYAPRVLSVLMDLIPRIITLRDETERLAARALLVTLCDRSTRLWNETPPRSFHLPAQWLEINPETLLLEARQELLQATTADIGAPQPSLEALLATSAPGYLLLNWPLRKLRPLLAPGALDGILVHPPVPNALYWALSALWHCWLWDEPAPAGLLTFLDRRRMDWEWSRRALALTLRSLRPYLRPGGLWLLHTPGLNLPALAAGVAAAADAGLNTLAWSVTAAGARLTLGVAGGADVGDAGAEGGGAERGERVGAGKGRSAPPSRGLEGALAAGAEARDVESVLRARGQPTAADVAQACTLISQKEQAPRLLRAARPSGPWVESPEKRLSLTEGHEAAPPLCERVEAELLALLRAPSSWTPAALRAALYARFPGVLTPEPELVEACIAAYAEPDAEGRLRLRAEDQPSLREAEVRQCRGWLAALGERLGFHLGFAPGWDVLWEESAPRYAFRVVISAALSEVMALSAPPGCRRVLVMPGSRAALLAWRFAQDTALRARMEREGWVVVKFRLLRRMVEELQTRAALESYVGLDPLMERDGSQLRLL